MCVCVCVRAYMVRVCVNICMCERVRAYMGVFASACRCMNERKKDELLDLFK